jgi:hypothetical protein
MDAATRRTVRIRASHCCEYCRLPQSATPFATFHVEHILAQQHVIDDSIANLALSCPDCNRYKGPNLTTIDIESQRIVPLFHPRLDQWEEHFEFQGALIVAKTVIGRATIRLLEMNSIERVEMRQTLLDVGEF